MLETCRHIEIHTCQLHFPIFYYMVHLQCLLSLRGKLNYLLSDGKQFDYCTDLYVNEHKIGHLTNTKMSTMMISSVSIIVRHVYIKNSVL